MPATKCTEAEVRGWIENARVKPNTARRSHEENAVAEVHFVAMHSFLRRPTMAADLGAGWRRVA